MTRRIRAYDKRIEELAAESYTETAALQQVSGVGALTALCFVLTLEAPERFKNGRAAAAYLGLCPRQSDSGESEPQLRITKAGSSMLRSFLVGSAHYILGPFGPDTDLRRWGLELAARGGKNAKKRAVVAVARKLSTLLYSLWCTGEVYEPLRSSHTQGEDAAAQVA
jgi:transposase